MVDVIGNISMNYCCIDVTDISAQVGDRIEIYSADQDAPHHLAHAAKFLGTIDYEIMVHWDKNIRREIAHHR
jgi:alanine racemase